MTQSLDAFFTGGSGGRSISWRDKPIGTTVTGIIEVVHPARQVTDPVSKELKFYKNGDPVMQVPIDLQTEFRQFEMCKPPEDPNETDDGRRTLYVGKPWMSGAIAEAIHKAGRKGAPEVGAKLSVTLTERTPNRDNPVLNPTNKFSAEYTPPSAQAAGQFFDTPATSNGPAVQRPASITEAAWAAMPPETQKQVAATFATMAGSSNEPPF